MFKSIWKILGFLTGFSTQAEIQIKTQAEVQAEVQAETHTLINLIKADDFSEFKNRLSDINDNVLLNVLKHISDNSGVGLRYISNISDVLRQEGRKSLVNKIYNYSSNSSNIFFKEAIKDVEFENSALERLEEFCDGKIAPCDHEKVLTPIAKTIKEEDAKKRFHNLMAFIQKNESVKESLDYIYWSQKGSEQFLYALEGANEGRRKEFLTDFITGKVQYSKYQRSVITEGINSSRELRAIFEKVTKYVEKDLSFLQKLQDLNNKMAVASNQSEKEEITKEFLQTKEETLKEEAQLPRTWQYITKNGDNHFCKELQTEKENRDTDQKTLELLKCLKRDNKAASNKTVSILASVVNDELSNNGICVIYKKTKEFISKDDFLQEVFDAIKEEKEQVVENSSSTELSKEQVGASSSFVGLIKVQCGGLSHKM